MKLESQSDEWLMGQVSRGDRACLEVLVGRFSGPMLTYLRRFLGDAHLAEEVFQEVFLAVWAKRRQYKFPRTFRAWLFAIGANKCREHFRRKKSRPSGSGEMVDVEDSESGPMSDAIQTENARAVNLALQSLTDQQRSVVILRVWNGLSYAEIATSIGAKEGTVRATMHRALEKLKPTLSRLCEG